MGALHAGHRSLIRQARADCDYVVVTVFVNPTQFSPHEDFNQYPRSLESDLADCQREDVDLVFHPETETMYSRDSATFVEVQGLSEVLEGAFRPGHFCGVTTVVTKLLNIVTADVAYFGRKDYQQQLVVRRLCRDLHVPVEIRTCPTVREPDGLALSSRNAYLDPTERRSALALSRSLKLAQELCAGGAPRIDAVRDAMRQLLQATPGVEVDYATIVHPETLAEIAAPIPEMMALVAARVGSVRLIDNLPIGEDNRTGHEWE